ncbi:hypothetical protein [Streptomyces sp. NPDC051173]|uniref:hypothetical protein n=1 Tax=Streptomyces sp. NPDC051173 TaxID=3155164 RepID=UPI00344DAFB5
MNIRRTAGIPRHEREGRPGDVLGVHPNTQQERSDARRLVQRVARDGQDVSELLDALGLTERAADE